MLFGTGLFHLVSERKRNDHRSAHIVDMARALVDNLKIGDMPQFNWDDKKITFTAWRMAVEKDACIEQHLGPQNRTGLVYSGFSNRP